MYTDPFGLCPTDVGGDGKTETVTDCPDDVMSGWEHSHISITASKGTDWKGVDRALRNAVIWTSMMYDASLGISAGREAGHSVEGRHAAGGAVDINTVDGHRFGAMPFDAADDESFFVAAMIYSFLPAGKKPSMVYTLGMAFRTNRPMSAAQRQKLLEQHRNHIHITVPK